MEYKGSSGGAGFSTEFRQLALSVVADSAHELKNERVEDAAQTLHVSARSIYRWAQRERDTGSVERNPKTSGSKPGLDSEGEVLLLLYVGALCFC